MESGATQSSFVGSPSFVIPRSVVFEEPGGRCMREFGSCLLGAFPTTHY
jgi:hypothetical protein